MEETTPLLPHRQSRGAFRPLRVVAVVGVGAADAVAVGAVAVAATPQ